MSSSVLSPVSSSWLSPVALSWPCWPPVVCVPLVYAPLLAPAVKGEGGIVWGECVMRMWWEGVSGEGMWWEGVSGEGMWWEGVSGEGRVCSGRVCGGECVSGESRECV